GSPPSSRLTPTAPASTTRATSSATAPGSPEYPASTSALTGTRATRAIAATAATTTDGGMALPSGYPCAQATPELVVAIACAPHSSTSRALAASQAFGSTSSLPCVWRPRNVDAVVMRTF